MLASGLFALDFFLSVNLNVALEVHSFVQHGSSLIRIRFHSQKHSKMLDMCFFFSMSTISFMPPSLDVLLSSFLRTSFSPCRD